jgi:hypothetical protein
MNFLFRADCSTPSDATRTRHPLVTLIIPYIDLFRLWVRGGTTRELHYGDAYSRFQPMRVPLRANPRRHRPLPRW